MAKGTQAKTQIMNKLMEVFNEAFLYNDGKELRIPMIENGEEVQIKVTLTCAKDNVVQGQDNALPGQVADPKTELYQFGEQAPASKVENNEVKPVELSKEEKENVKSLLEALGL